MELGTQAPEFLLPDTVSGNMVSFSEVKGTKGTLVYFICNHCPYVVHVMETLARLSNEWKKKGLGVVAISSNDVANYPDDSPANMKDFAAQYGFEFPYLYDESQEVAKVYDAACTPDIYLFDQDQRCYYHGRLDGSRPGNDIPVDGADLSLAVISLFDGKPAPQPQIPSAGCNIKWKA